VPAGPVVEPLDVVEHSRLADLDDNHGPSRLAILFLGADGHATYDALFCQPGQQAPFAVLLQDHGFAGNYSNWGDDGIAARIARETGCLPEMLLVDDNTTKPWCGYTKVDGVEATIGGMWANRRYLYRRTD